MVHHLGEGCVCLAKGVGLLPRGLAGLHRRINAIRPQRSSELLIGHEDGLGFVLGHIQAKAFNQGLLAFHHFRKVPVQQLSIQLNGWLGVQPDHQINDAHLLRREPLSQPAEQPVGEVHVLHTVVSKAPHSLWCEVTAAHTYGTLYLVAFLTQPIVSSQGFE